MRAAPRRLLAARRCLAVLAAGRAPRAGALPAAARQRRLGRARPHGRAGPRRRALGRHLRAGDLPAAARRHGLGVDPPRHHGDVDLDGLRPGHRVRLRAARSGTARWATAGASPPTAARTWRNWTYDQLGTGVAVRDPDGHRRPRRYHRRRDGGRAADHDRRRRALDRHRRRGRAAGARPRGHGAAAAHQRVRPPAGARPPRLERHHPARQPAADRTPTPDGRRSRWPRPPFRPRTRCSSAASSTAARRAGSGRPPTRCRASTRTAPDAGAPRTPLTVWLRRPIARTDNAYIDQTYRYGSTMGGFFQQHQGVEFNNPDGTPVMAALGRQGGVRRAGRRQGANTVAIRHDTTVKAHGKSLPALFHLLPQLVAGREGGRAGQDRTGDRPSRQHRPGHQRSPSPRAGRVAHRLDRRDRRLAAALPAVHRQSRALDRAAAGHRHRGGPGVRRGRRRRCRRRGSTASSSATRWRRRSPTRRPTATRRTAIRSTASISPSATCRSGTYVRGHRDRRQEGLPPRDRRGGQAHLGGVQALMFIELTDHLRCPGRARRGVSGAAPGRGRRALGADRDARLPGVRPAVRAAGRRARHRRRAAALRIRRRRG